MTTPQECGAIINPDLATRVPKYLQKGLVGLWRSENDGEWYFVGENIFDCGFYATQRELIEGLRRRYRDLSSCTK